MRHFKDDLEAVTAEAEELIRTDDCRASTLDDLDSPRHLGCHSKAASLWALLSFGNTKDANAAGRLIESLMYSGELKAAEQQCNRMIACAELRKTYERPEDIPAGDAELLYRACRGMFLGAQAIERAIYLKEVIQKTMGVHCRNDNIPELRAVEAEIEARGEGGEHELSTHRWPAPAGQGDDADSGPFKTLGEVRAHQQRKALENCEPHEYEGFAGMTLEGELASDLGVRSGGVSDHWDWAPTELGTDPMLLAMLQHRCMFATMHDAAVPASSDLDMVRWFGQACTSPSRWRSG